MKNMSKFQLILTGIFAVFIVIGVMVFALFRNDSTSTVSSVLVWGNVPSSQFTQILKVNGLDKDESFAISYVEKRTENFDTDFIEALADGRGPDLFFLPQSSVLKHRTRIYPIPYKSYPERDFKNTFIEGAEVFLSPQGIMALPYIVDPLVMYWNRSLFTNAGLAREPRFWDEVYSLTGRLTKKDSALNITQSTIPFGEFRNVSNAKAILSMLILQAGNPITSMRSDGVVQVSLSSNLNLQTTPAHEALRFFTDFSNPSTVYYSWNRSLPLSRNFFTAGDSALYFGFASELPDIQRANPNLNFDVAPVPQSRQAKKEVSYADFYGLAVSKNSRNITGAFALAYRLTDALGIGAVVDTLKLPPVRRDLVAATPVDPYMAVFHDAALRAKTWLGPDAAETSRVFQSMVESVTAGRSQITEAVGRADEELRALIVQ